VFRIPRRERLRAAVCSQHVTIGLSVRNLTTRPDVVDCSPFEENSIPGFDPLRASLDESLLDDRHRKASPDSRFLAIFR
jgi:hypothetical protein